MPAVIDAGSSRSSRWRAASTRPACCTFLKDRRTKMALGVFLGTYVYALVTPRAVRWADEAGGQAAFVPTFSVPVSRVEATDAG
jgi:uncharacterized membrane protein